MNSNYEGNKGKLMCDLDGDALCIMRKDFKDLMISPSMFIKLNKRQLKEFEQVKNGKNTKMKIDVIYTKCKCGANYSNKLLKCPNCGRGNEYGRRI